MSVEISLISVDECPVSVEKCFINADECSMSVDECLIGVKTTLINPNPNESLIGDSIPLPGADGAWKGAWFWLFKENGDYSGRI
jgi:hypothetical protein